MPQWDIFCTVVDNYGDIGVCWRLARQLVDEHGVDVRLWVDRLESFAHLCPAITINADRQTVQQVEVRHWRADFPAVEVADVVIEAFACELPETYAVAMAERAVPPIWINLEYLSAEDWVEGCHLLASPHPQYSLTKHFFFPGFTDKTGGLLRERGLLANRAAFNSNDAEVFWSMLLQIPARTEAEIRISLFCYDNAALPGLVQCWADGPDPIRVLATPGAATQQVANWFGKSLVAGDVVRKDSLTVHVLPFLPHAGYDWLLWSCDVNFVRGEDSFVRAQWAQRPFVWQIYPQADDAHLVKLNAFLGKYLDNFEAAVAVKSLWHAWNEHSQRVAGAGPAGSPGNRAPGLPVGSAPATLAPIGMAAAWQDFATNRLLIEQHGKEWATRLDRLNDLSNNLVRFVCEN